MKIIDIEQALARRVARHGVGVVDQVLVPRESWSGLVAEIEGRMTTRTEVTSVNPLVVEVAKPVRIDWFTLNSAAGSVRVVPYDGDELLMWCAASNDAERCNLAREKEDPCNGI